MLALSLKAGSVIQWIIKQHPFSYICSLALKHNSTSVVCCSHPRPTTRHPDADAQVLFCSCSASSSRCSCPYRFIVSLTPGLWPTRRAAAARSSAVTVYSSGGAVADPGSCAATCRTIPSPQMRASTALRWRTARCRSWNSPVGQHHTRHT